MLKTIVKELLDSGFQERPDLFLIDFEVLDDNSIRIVIDGDNGVLVEDCIFISRLVEHQLDREEYDFSIEVTSSGATAPFTQIRQFKKNIGRILEVKTAPNTKVKGELVEASDTQIVMVWKAREPKPVGKGKITVNKQINIAYDDIIEAKVIIKF